MEADLLLDYCPRNFGLDDLIVFQTSLDPSSWLLNLSKAPSSSEAISRSDASVWHAAMDRELKSLDDMGAEDYITSCLLALHAALKIVMTTCYITSAGVLGAQVIWQVC
jgi:hypothetical protein